MIRLFNIGFAIVFASAVTFGLFFPDAIPDLHGPD